VKTVGDAAVQKRERESRQRQLDREVRAISMCNQTLLRAEDEQTLLNEICRIVCDEAGYCMAWVGYREDDAAKTIRPVARGGADGSFLEQVHLSWSDGNARRGPAGAAIGDGRIIVIQDLRNDPAAAMWREGALKRGFHSAIALPLKDDSQNTFGVLVIYASAPDAFTPDETRLLEELSGDLAFGVVVLRTRFERKRLEQQRQATLHFFASMDRVNLAIQEQGDFEQMLSDVLGVVLSIFGCDRALLLYPCELDAVTWRATMERALPDYPGISAHSTDVSVDPQILDVFRAVRASKGPVIFGPEFDHPLPTVATLEFGVQSMLAMAIYPKGDAAYMFGLHQCSHIKVWTEEEQALMQEIGRRLADGLSSMLAYRNLRQNEARLRVVMQTIPDLVWLKDLDGRFLSCNRQFEALYGASEAQIIGKTDYDFVDKEQADFFREYDRRATAAGKPCTNEEWLTFVETGYRGLFETVKTPLWDHSGMQIGVLGIARDITERHWAEEERRITATAFEAQEGIVITGADRTILRVNRAFTDITGYTGDDAIGQTLHLVHSDRQDPAVFQAISKDIAHTGSWQGEVWQRRKTGEHYPAWLNITAVKNERGAITHYVATVTDITSRKAAEREIENLAFYDPLTQLPNRRLLLDRLRQALSGSARCRRKGALLFIDLDNFKILNDTIGHDVGDRLLCEVARRLTGTLRDGDTIGRLGGDEFVVILEALSECPREAAAQAKANGERILAVLNRPYTIAGHVHHSTPSIGVALFADTGDSVDDLLKQADIAMYQAKAAGRNTLRLFDPDMHAALADRANLEVCLRRGIQRREFVLHYQPQVDSARGIIGVEALLRWEHPERGMMMPAQFIPLAEETGLILPIGRWVVETACTQLKSWMGDPRTRDLLLAVNVSARQFRQSDIVDQVRQALLEAGAPPERLKLELTESLVLDDIEDTIQKMSAFRELGVGFSMDDFGTGYSCLSNLTRLPLDQLKIDRSFVRNLPDSPNDAAVIQTIITLAHSLGLSVIAEGVETEAQRQFLQRHGCPIYQGNLFSTPVAPAVFEQLLMRDWQSENDCGR
jgi:diguanylate cyclase (GGDEF)-like protein/PAS domain S-box-containing protein